MSSSGARILYVLREYAELGSTRWNPASHPRSAPRRTAGALPCARPQRPGAPREIAKKHLEGRRAVLREITEVIEEGVTAGRFRPVDAGITALSIISMCNWVAWWFHPSPAHPAEPVAEQFAENAVAMVARDARCIPDTPNPLGIVSLLRQDLDHLARLLTAEDERRVLPPGKA
ncbi:hypothetical protein [Streptomyces sp. NPDC056987]|uniref:hypothetical protein n=1 Tax=Streptomyces sp. NPDC056987 TaxID=3345988 RepID=UPI003625543B